MILPKTPSKPLIEEPRRLFLFSHPKVGKTSGLMQLPNNLVIDLEDSAEFYQGMAINVKKLSVDSQKDMLTILGEIRDTLIQEKSQGFSYDFITIDTTSVLENIAREYALSLYKSTNIGKGFKGTDIVTELPQGGGYEWLRLAFDKIYKSFNGLPNKCLILSGHVKTASINKDGKDLQAKDVQLTGKLKQIVCSDADAIGFLRRDKETNKNVISFKTTEQDLATGSRLPYLSGKEIIISEMINNELVTYWEEIFPSLKQ